MTLPKLLQKPDLNPQQLASIGMALLIILFGAYVVVQLIEKRYQQSVENTLNSVLNATLEASKLWRNELQNTVQNLAKEKIVRDAARELLTVPHKREPLLAADAQQRLRGLMQPYLNNYRGYFLIAPDNISLASSRDSNIGTPNLLLKYPDVLAKLWGGETRLTPLQRSDVSLSTVIEKLPQPGDDTLFVGTPVRDEDGTVIALFTLRVDPYTTLFSLTGKGWLGKTGESYFFDRNGILLSQSRFEKQLVDIGLLEQGKSSVANLCLRDPGTDLTQSDTPTPVADKQPLTRMAACAINCIDGVNVTGYRDYRGVPVVGAWHWDEQMDIGLATEQDVAEAYELFYFVRLMIYGGAVIAALILLALVWVFVSGKKRLAQLQLRLESIVETAVDGIVVIDERGIIISVNPAMEAIFGYTAQELVGSNVSILMPEPHRSQHDTYLARYQQSGEDRIIGIKQDVEGQRKDGSTFSMLLSVNRLEVSGGFQFAGVIHDITERKEAEKSILKAREEAVAANRAKSTFLATMSHEIRTPLNGVVGTIDMLAHTSLTPAQMDMIATAHDSAILLQGIIDDILDFSKIEAGKLELDQVPIDLEPLVEKLGENLQHIALGRQVELLLYVEPTLPQVKGDPVRLRQILYNLAENAIKFSSVRPDRAGQVVISVMLDERIDTRVQICFRVSDNGIGMSPEVQERLFEPFVQGEGEITRRFGGTGLGLVITQRLVEMMGGTIDMQSSVGEGSTFTVHIALEEIKAFQETTTSKLDGTMVVLLTRDESAQIMSSYLLHAGAEVLTVDADNVIELCKKRCSDINELVVIIDTRGDKELSTALRDAILKEIGDIDLRFLVVERGNRRYARAYEDDGFTLDLNAMRRHTLVNTVAALVGRESPEQGRMVSLRALAKTPLSMDEAMEKGRLILLADDIPTNRKVISRQLSMLGYLADLAADGAEALRMWRAGNYNLLLTDCHMPVMDGYQLSETIRQEEPEGSHLPIIAITGDALKGTAQKCLAAGMDNYLTKPLQLPELREVMEKWLPTETPTTTKEQNANGGEKSKTPPDTAFDPHALGNLLGSQEQGILAEYYNDFLVTSTPTVKQIETAFSEKDLSAVRELAHKLKSSARTVGANDLADCCQALETSGKEGNAKEMIRQMVLLSELFHNVKKWIENHNRAE